MENKSESNVLVYIDDNGVCKIRLVGQIKYGSNAKGLSEFVNTKVAEESVKDVIVDLRECDFIDSTNIGNLGKIAKLQQEKGAKKPTLVYSEDSKVISAIEDVNMDVLFEVCVDKEMGDNDYEDVGGVDTNKNELAKIMLDSHKFLSDFNDSNKKKFESVVKYLSGEVSANERKTTSISRTN